VERCPAMIKILIERGERFWHDHVLKRVPPDPSTSEEANVVWRRAKLGAVVLIGHEVGRAIADLEETKAAQKLLGERRDALELTIKRTLKDAEAIVDEEGHPFATWKEQSSTRFDQRRFREEHQDLFADYATSNTYRVLRVTKRGKELNRDDI
jgi:predicted phage-related endonuclease